LKSMGRKDSVIIATATAFSAFVLVGLANMLLPDPAVRLLLFLLAPLIAPFLGIAAMLAIRELPRLPARLRNVKAGRWAAEVAALELRKLAEEHGVDMPNLGFEADWCMAVPVAAKYLVGENAVVLKVKPDVAKLWVEDRARGEGFIRHVVAHEFAHHMQYVHGKPIIVPERYEDWRLSPSEVEAEKFAAERSRYPYGKVSFEAEMAWVKDPEKGVHIVGAYEIEEAANKRAKKLVEKFREEMAKGAVGKHGPR
jgi:hypothetical protein